MAEVSARFGIGGIGLHVGHRMLPRNKPACCTAQSRAARPDGDKSTPTTISSSRSLGYVVYLQNLCCRGDHGHSRKSRTSQPKGLSARSKA
jgi:hypothetical protein